MLHRDATWANPNSRLWLERRKCRVRVRVRSLLLIISPPRCEKSSFYFLLFSEVFIIPWFASVSRLSLSLFHTLTSTICYTPSVFFRLILCDYFQLSFYLLHEGRNSFIYFSLFPEPDAQSLAHTRCFKKCLLNWSIERGPLIIPSRCVFLPWGFHNKMAFKHYPFLTCYTLRHVLQVVSVFSFPGISKMYSAPGDGAFILPFPHIFMLGDHFLCSTNHPSGFWPNLAFACASYECVTVRHYNPNLL